MWRCGYQLGISVVQWLTPITIGSEQGVRRFNVDRDRCATLTQPDMRTAAEIVGLDEPPSMELGGTLGPVVRMKGTTHVVCAAAAVQVDVRVTLE